MRCLKKRMAPIESFGFEAQFLRKPPFTIEFDRRLKAKSVKIPAEYGSLWIYERERGGSMWVSEIKLSSVKWIKCFVSFNR